MTPRESNRSGRHRASGTRTLAPTFFVRSNPSQARRFAEATGKLAKTDRLDAAMLARWGAMLQLSARPPRGENILELKGLHLPREVKDRTAAKNRSKVLALPLSSAKTLGASIRSKPSSNSAHDSSRPTKNSPPASPF